MRKFILVGLLAIFTASCTTTKSSTSKTIDIVGAGVIHKPIVADLEVNPIKTSKTVELKNVLSLDNAKNEVLAIEGLLELAIQILQQETLSNK